MKTIGQILIFELATAVCACMKEGIHELSVIANGPITRCSVGVIEIHDMCVFRMRVDHPLEWLRTICILRLWARLVGVSLSPYIDFTCLGDHDAGIGTEGIGTHAIYDFHVVIVVTATITKRVK